MAIAARFHSRFYVGFALTTLVVGFGILGPLLNTRKPNENVGGRYDPPASDLWLGTDQLGHDVLVNLMHGTRTSLTIGVGAGVIATLLGVTIGLIAGYKGGVIEELLMGFTNIALAIPGIVVLILLSIALGSRSIYTMMLVIGVISWPWTARAVAAQSSSVRTREHLDVARLSGARTPSILIVDVLMYLLSYICMAFVLQVAAAILTEAALSLLGLGPSKSVSLGVMLNLALTGESMRLGYWWAILPTTVMLTVIAFGLLMLQSSLDQLFNPRLRGSNGGHR